MKKFIIAIILFPCICFAAPAPTSLSGTYTHGSGASGGPSGSSTSNVDNILFDRSTGSGYNYYDDVWISDSDTGWETW